MYHHVYFGWELGIPLVSWMIVPYHLFNLLFLIPFFILRFQGIYTLGISTLICTLISGIIFIFIPTELGFERVIPDNVTGPLYSALFAIDRPSNLLPSLHVVYTTLFFISSIEYFQKRSTKIFITVCILIIISSTIFTHQHHIIDVITGVILATIVHKFVKSRLFSTVAPL